MTDGSLFLVDRIGRDPGRIRVLGQIRYILPASPEFLPRPREDPMKRWMLAALLFVSPAFAATMNTYGSQLGGANLVQLVPGELPMLATTYAGTSLQNTFPRAVIFETNLAPLGTTLAYTLSMGGRLSAFPCRPTPVTPQDASSPQTLLLPGFSRPTPGALTVTLNDSATVFHSVLPEPASLVLLTTGLIAVTWRKRRSRAKGSSIL
jgi:hypothetical protein